MLGLYDRSRRFDKDAPRAADGLDLFAGGDRCCLAALSVVDLPTLVIPGAIITPFTLRRLPQHPVSIPNVTVKMIFPRFCEC